MVLTSLPNKLDHPSTSVAQTLRILIVDDDQDLRSVLTAFLTRKCHTVYACATIRQCLDAVQAAEYDIAIVDGALERRPSFDLIRKLKQNNSPMAVVVLTGTSDAEHRQGALDAGADSYVTKPISLTVLESLLWNVGAEVRVAAS